MSTSSPSSFATSQRVPTTLWKTANSTFSPNLQQSTTSHTKWQTSSNKQLTGQVASTSQVLASNTCAIPAAKEDKSKGRKRRKLDNEEETIKNSVFTAISLSLASDQILALYPDADTPFESEVDAVDRLLPYHIFQHPQEDLQPIQSRKGKGKATAHDDLREEIRETKYALECWRRRQALEDRFRKARMRSGKYSSPHDQTIILAQSIVEAERLLTRSAEHELTSSRAELDRLVRAQKAAAMQAGRQQPQASSSSFSYSSFVYPKSTQPHPYYNNYTYPYGQSNPHAQQAQTASSSVMTNGKSSTTSLYAQASARQPVQHKPGDVSPTSALTSVSASAPTSTTAATPTGQASIPVQLPVTSLPALQAFGILPVPKAALPPPSQPQPPAVLLGSTNGGSTLLLEINVGLLQATQMSGLAIILSGLMQRPGAGPATAAPAVAGASSGTVQAAAPTGTGAGLAAAPPTTGAGASVVTTSATSQRSGSAGGTRQAGG